MNMSAPPNSTPPNTTSQNPSEPPIAHYDDGPATPLRLADEDLWLCLAYVAPAERARVAALFDLAVALRRVPAMVKEPPIGEIRLQWWREALDDIVAGARPRGHPTLQALSASGGLDQAARDSIETGLDARARFLYADPFQSVEELYAVLRDAEGWLAAALGHPGAQDLAGLYALARWPQPIERLGETERAAFVDAAMPGARDAAAADDVAAIGYMALTKGYLKRAPGAPWPALKRLVLVRAIATGHV